MKKIAIIPARFAATRFPGKLMKMLGDKTVIRTTYENTVATGLFDDVIVVTDHENIYDEIKANKGSVLRSKKEHESGSDRIAEAVRDMDVDVIVNVQGDEPFVDKRALGMLLNAFNVKRVSVASLMRRSGIAEAENPNNVKVVVDKDGNALYFSRSIIPHSRDNNNNERYFIHVGIYAYRKEALLNFTKLPISQLEKTERLEQLRYLENGIPIRMIETEHRSVAIDTPDDLEAAKRLMNY